MALDFGNKTANGGTNAQGILTANEFNQLVAAVNNNMVEVVDVTGTTPTQQLAPNTFYVFGNVTSLTVTLGSAVSGIANIYAFCFTAGVDNPTITLPQGVQIADAPTIANGDYVEFNIMNNKAIAKVWSAS